jgi:predicted CoA-binding protein
MGRTSVPEVFFQPGLDVTGGLPRDSVRQLCTQELVQIYERIKTIAVVGASADETKTANVIPSYLQSQGYRILPVNPRGGEILGERAYATLQDVDLPIDVVDVFRPPAEAEAVARAAIAKGVAICGSSQVPILTRLPLWLPTRA